MQKKQENGFVSIIFNIILPVLILNKGSKFVDPKVALVVALLFPLAFGVWDYLQKGKINPISALGLLNVGITGGLALSGLSGMWFSVKEAAFPLLVGAFVFASAFSATPFISQLFLNPQAFRVELIEQKVKEHQRENDFKRLLKNATMMLSASFLLSAVLNFVLAVRIFLPIDETLSEQAHAEALNSQIAQMTSWSFAVILIPSIIFLMGILYYLVKSLQKITGLATEDLWHQN